MKRLSSILMVLALTIFPASEIHAQGSTQKLKITSISGSVQYKVGGTVTNIVQNADGSFPDIPAGAEIIVVSGNATFSSGNTSITANTGDSFTFTAPNSGGVQIAATGNNTSITVDNGGASAAVGSGDTIAVGQGNNGFDALSVVAGNVPVTRGILTNNLGVGQSEPLAPTGEVGGRGGSFSIGDVGLLNIPTLNLEDLGYNNPNQDAGVSQQQHICGDTSPSTPC